METTHTSKRKLVYKGQLGKIRKLTVEVGYACQCFKDCYCAEDYFKANPHRKKPPETFFRVERKTGKNPKKNKFTTYADAWKALTT